SSAYFVDSSFLQMFDFKLIRGNRETVLQKPNNAVLTTDAAQRLFGNEDPIGKTINHYGDDTSQFVVTGIMENVPSNSQFQFEGLFSFSTIRADWMIKNWGGNWLNTYLELAPNTNVASLEKRFPAYLKSHMKGDSWKSYELFLLPLQDV